MLEPRRHFVWLQKVSSFLGALELGVTGCRRQPWLTKAIRTKRRDPSFDGSKALVVQNRDDDVDDVTSCSALDAVDVNT